LPLEADAGQILAFFGLLFGERTGEDGNEVKLEGELLGTDFLNGCFQEFAVFGFGLFRDDLSFGLMGLGIHPADQVASSGIQQRARMFLELQSLSVPSPVQVDHIGGRHIIGDSPAFVNPTDTPNAAQVR
jgi:hypothetical protein